VYRDDRTQLDNNKMGLCLLLLSLCFNVTILNMVLVMGLVATDPVVHRILFS
jgi:hypothetical protein